VPVKKKRTHNPWQQAGEGSDCRSGLGSNKNQRYILQCEVSPVGSKTRQKESLDSRRTFDPEVCLPHTQHFECIPGTWSRPCQPACRSQTQVLSQKRIRETGIWGNADGIKSRITNNKGRFLLAQVIYE